VGCKRLAGREHLPEQDKIGTTSSVETLIADKHELVRRGLISILNSGHPEWHIVADVASGAAAVERGIALRPNVAIVDLSLPDITGLQVAERLAEAVPGIRILVLTMRTAAHILRQLRKTGVSAYLVRNEAPMQLVPAVERILAGEPFFQSASASLPATAAAEEIPVQFLLTPRELDVLRLLARGKTNKELAADLSISVRTAESHRAHILAKLNVESLGELVRFAVRDGVT
jgi:DNA-binding NarL/FixJ family response regulator